MYGVICKQYHVTEFVNYRYTSWMYTHIVGKLFNIGWATIYNAIQNALGKTL